MRLCVEFTSKIKTCFNGIDYFAPRNLKNLKNSLKLSADPNINIFMSDVKWFEKFLGPKSVLVQKIVGPKKCFGPNIFGLKKNFGSKKI